MQADSYLFGRYKCLIINVLFLLISSILNGQKFHNSSDSLQIIFYNVENLFDVYDDPLTDDNEFIPTGDRYWTQTKYNRKINQISQAILSFANFEIPAILGLCEIENERILEDLTHVQLLNQAPLKIIHKNSYDRRGIDVAVIYDSTRVKPLYFEFIPVRFSNGDHSRDVLYTKVEILRDSLHVFVNHWPSRYTGARNTEERRMDVARIIIAKCDSILKINQNAKLLLMGDFNDEPSDKSVKYISSFKQFDRKEKVFHNLMDDKQKALGTIKYQGRWSVFDQFIVSLSLENAKFGLQVRHVKIANQKFLFEDDNKYLGRKPFRTFNGFKYLGGFSDHLPIKLTLSFKR